MKIMNIFVFFLDADDKKLNSHHVDKLKGVKIPHHQLFDSLRKEVCK